MTILETQGLAARNAGRVLAVAGTAAKNAALEAAAKAIEASEDLAAAKAAGMRPALVDRLALDEGRIAGIVEGVRQVAALPDPIGQVVKMETRPNGLTIGKRRVPLGVIGIIYEARPNVTVDAAALCLKSGNAVILRGGKEAFRSNKAFVAVLRDALESAGLPRDCVALVEDTSRESANELMRAHPPRGRGADPERGEKRPGAGDPDRRGCVPRLCPRGGRPGHGRPHPPQRQDLPAVGVQRRRVPAGRPGGGAGLPAHGVAAAPDQKRGAAGLPRDPGHPGGLRQARRGRRLGHRVRRLHPGRQGGVRL